MMLNGVFLDMYDSFCTIDDAYWFDCLLISSNIKMLGALLALFVVCDYSKIRTKVLSFHLLIWQIVVIIYNSGLLFDNINTTTIFLLTFLYMFWVLRLSLMPHIKDSEPKFNSAYYILYPINSIKGIMQAIFIPWHSPRYETRMISDGIYVWYISNGVFKKRPLHTINLPANGVKYPIDKILTYKKRSDLDSLVGKRAIPGIIDCRKFLIFGRPKVKS